MASRALRSAATASVVALVLLGCQRSDDVGTAQTSASPRCEGALDPATYRVRGKRLEGDVDGDDRADRVTLRVDERRPLRCRFVLTAEVDGGSTVVVAVKPVPWPGTDPRLRLLAQIDRRPGLEAAVALSPAAVYRPGAVYTLRDARLVRIRREVAPKLPDDLFPFDDEFPAGVDCAGKPGAIVVTIGNLAEQGRDDRHWDITRSFYRAAGIRFELVRDVRFRVDVGPEPKRRWPELRGRPFRSCHDLVE
jgi:hypothetical protein